MNLLIRTFRSFTRKERWALLFWALIFMSSIVLFVVDQGLSGSESSKIYSEAMVGEFEHLNPVLTEFNEADADVSSLIFSGLVKFNPENGQFEEDMATHTLSADHLVYTFTLKNNVVWQDGEPVTAEDLYFTFHDIIQSENFENPVLKSNFEGVQIEKPDSRTISFTLNTPNSFFYSGLTVGILPQHILGETAVTELEFAEFNEQPIGTGPYQVTGPYTKNSNGSQVNLTRFTNYYGPAPKIERLRMLTYPDWETLLENRSTWHAVARVKDVMSEEMDTENLVAYHYTLPQYTAIFLNTDSPKLTKNKTRLGLLKAIDKTKLLNDNKGFLSIDTPILELSQDEWIYSPNSEEAKGAFYDAGWPLAEGETVRKNSDGEPLSLNLLRRDFSVDQPNQEAWLKTVTDELVQQWAAIGVEVKVKSLSLSELDTAIADRDYDLLLYGQGLGYNLDVFSYWHSSQATSHGLNLSNYQNPRADALMESIRQSFDTEKREKELKELAGIISEDVPAIFLFTPDYTYWVDSRVTGIKLEKILSPKDRFGTIENWSF